MDHSLPGGKRTTLNLLFLIGNAAAAATGAAAAAWAVWQHATGAPFEDRELSQGLWLVTMAARLFLFSFGGIVFLVWLHRSYSNTQMLGSTKHSPALVTGSFFFPFAQLVLPYRAIQEMWRNSEIRPGVIPRNARLILAWWLLLLAWESVFFIAIDEMPENTLPSQVWWGAVLAGEVCGTIAAGLGGAMVFLLRRRQTNQAQAQRTATYAVPATPLTYPA